MTSPLKELEMKRIVGGLVLALAIVAFRSKWNAETIA
jgi:hypothetical protein